jgi:hypothetical protein
MKEIGYSPESDDVLIFPDSQILQRFANLQTAGVSRHGRGPKALCKERKGSANTYVPLFRR